MESPMMRGRYLIGSALPLVTVGSAGGQDLLRYRYQWYDEEDGRIDVESQYLDFEKSWGETKLGVRLAVDRLSGMTPTGTHAIGDPDTWEYAEIDDERYVGVLTLEHEIDDYTLTFEYANSQEEDYRSHAVTGKVSRQFNAKNTTITGGVSYATDEVVATKSTNIPETEGREVLDVSFGFSQILTPSTLFDLNLGYGYSQGYLADPYRSISKIEEIASPFGGVIPVTLGFPESRPDELHRFVAKATVRQYFEKADAALKFSYRLFGNSDSVVGHTLEAKWIQQVTKGLSVSPYVRYYQQSEAEYYYPTLTGTGLSEAVGGVGSEPHYSSDYRLSKFESLTYGVRFAWEVRDNVTLDLQVERYEMNGLGSGTPDEFFPTANVVSAGLQWRF